MDGPRDITCIIESELNSTQLVEFKSLSLRGHFNESMWMEN